MKLDKKSAHEIAHDVMTLMCKGPPAAEDLNALLNEVHDEVATLSDVQLITYLRSSFTARYHLENWWRVRDKTLEQFTERHGPETAARFMMGLLGAKDKVIADHPTLFPAWRS